MVTHQLQVRCRPKFAGQRPTFYHRRRCQRWAEISTAPAPLTCSYIYISSSSSSSLPPPNDVMFSLLFVCLSVCVFVNKITHKVVVDRFLMKSMNELAWFRAEHVGQIRLWYESMISFSTFPILWDRAFSHVRLDYAKNADECSPLTCYEVILLPSYHMSALSPPEGGASHTCCSRP